MSSCFSSARVVCWRDVGIRCIEPVLERLGRRRSKRKGMTETETKWAARVSEWRASGQTAKDFCEGKEFAAGGLRYWSSRLNRREPEKSQVRSVRMARVIRTVHAMTRTVASMLVVELAGARIEVRRGFDPQLLRSIVDAP